MKYSTNWLKKYVDLPSNLEELNKIIDQIAYQIVDVDERWLGSKENEDTVIDVDNKIITNRPYAFGHRGLAREIAVMLGKDWKGALYPILPKRSNNEDLKLAVEVLDPELCPRFTAIAIRGIKVGPSPKWLVDALTSIGQRSINNIVDITNYIMFDTAQPVHAYDYDKIKDGHFIIRRAKQGEKVVTLDGVERVLDSEMVLITDSEKVIGIGGVMGAGNSEVDDNTTNIVLEIASFDPINIRQTAKKLKHRTDAVTRFEKGQDPKNILKVQPLLASLTMEVCGGEIASELIDINNLEFSNLRHEPLIMEFDHTRVDKLLGFGISEEFIRKVLGGFGIRLLDENENIWTLEIPTFRPDIKEPSDLIEDIGRMYGYQNIPVVTPVNELTIPPINPKVQVKTKSRKALNGSGLDEVLAFSFISAKDIQNLEKLGIPATSAVKIVNPLSNEYDYLRTSLIPSLAKFAALNLKYLNEFGGFEIARKYEKNPAKSLPYDEDKGESQRPVETELISGIYFDKKNPENSLAKLKGALENLAYELRIGELRIDNLGGVLIGDQKIGQIQMLDSSYLAEYDIDVKCAVFEIELQGLVNNYVETIQFKDFSRFQGTKLEYSILIPENLSIQELKNYLPVHELIVKSEVLEVYRDKKKFGEKKSVLVRFDLQKMDGNLTSHEAYEVGQRIEESLKRAEGLEIRGGGVSKPTASVISDQSSVNSKKEDVVIPAQAGIQGGDAMASSPVVRLLEEDSVTGELPAVVSQELDLAKVREELAKISNPFIVEGKILSIEKHPNADRLVICKVDVGDKKPEGTISSEYLQIVTGAPNIVNSLNQQIDKSIIGAIVPVALPGAEVKSHKTGEEITIKISELRGVQSEGMLCSADELGLPNPGYDGILILDRDFSTEIF